MGHEGRQGKEEREQQHRRREGREQSGTSLGHHEQGAQQPLRADLGSDARQGAAPDPPRSIDRQRRERGGEGGGAGDEPHGSAREPARAPSELSASDARLLSEERAALPNAALVMLSHDRADYLATTLSALLALEDVGAVSVYVSLDKPSAFERMEAIVRRVSAERQVPVTTWRHPPRPRAGTGPAGRPVPLALIASHFCTVLARALNEPLAHSHAILLEDDLLPAPDLLSLFRAAAPLLRADPSLWCVSAWNDNGLARGSPPAAELGRTDFFPGLGWMVSQAEWRQTLRAPWLRASAGAQSTGWDYWLRFSGLLGGRECIFPLTPRTRHIGRRGTNVNAREAAFLDGFATSAMPATPLSRPAARAYCGGGACGQLSGLEAGAYERFLGGLVAGQLHPSGEPVALAAAAAAYSAAPIVAGELVAAGGSWEPLQPLARHPQSAVTVVPFSAENYPAIAKRLALWPAHPRATHKGLVRTGHAGGTVLLVDRRSGEAWLPPKRRIARHPQAQTLAASAAGQSCDAACAERGLRCDEEQLQFCNNCRDLRAHFPCEGGCGHQVGAEIPCYVSEAGRDTHTVCLHSDVISKCAAAFKATTRLCVCVP
jgi:alpha-1,3-mannosyl-glycoprotein beta-1,2-N-acetylglucosaminyltransferase